MNVKKLLPLFFITLLLVGCNKDEDVAGKINKPERDLIFAPRVLDLETKAGVETARKWDVGDTIKIKFLNGSEAQKEYVKNNAKEWLAYANVKFEYVTGMADVRIGFDFEGDYINWSYIGTECRLIPQSLATANFGFLTEDCFEYEESRAQVLQIFGNILGLVYEHKTPAAGIKWKESLVIKYLRQNGWDNRMIGDFFMSLNEEQSNSTEFDENSIMVYYVPSHLTEDGYGTKLNVKLSESDKSFMKELYPYETPKPVGRKVIMDMTTYHSGAYGLAAYNYDDPSEYIGNKIRKTYNTVIIGEQEWTSENLRMKYHNLWGTLYNFMNFDQNKIDNVFGGGKDYCSFNEFEEMFGTWVTSYQEALSYRNSYTFTDLVGDTIPDFYLPTKEDILQLIGQAPEVYGNNVIENFKDFTFASSKDVTHSFGSHNLELYNNTSGLSLTPLGFKENRDDGTGPHYSFGYGLGLKLKEDLSRIFYISDAKGMGVNIYLYHFTQARYCKQLDLDYKLYVDTDADKVIVSKKGNLSDLKELPKGLERGIALRYKKGETIDKSWSEIVKIAENIYSQIEMQ